MSLIIKYMHSRVQLFINIIHLIIFIIITLLGAYYGGLVGFAVAAMIGNVIRFLIVALVAIFIKYEKKLIYDTASNSIKID